MGVEGTPASARAGSIAATGTNAVRLLAWAGIVVGVVYLTFGGGGSYGITDVRFRILSLAVIAIAMLAWLVAAVRDASWRPRSVLWPGFAAALAAFGVSTLTSWSPRLSVEYVAYAVLCTALYLLLVRLFAHPAFAQRLGALTVVLCLATGVEYVILVLARWTLWWIALGHLAIPPLRPGSEGLAYGNPSAVATMMLLLGPASVAFLGGATRGRRLMIGLLVALTAAVVVTTESRGAWLGLGVAAGGLVVALLAVPAARDALRQATRSWRGRLTIGAVLIPVLAAGALLGPAVIRRAVDSEGSRLSFFATAIRMFESSPLVGSGPGTWVARRISFTNAATEIDGYVPHAHNIFLQTLAEFGLVGLVAGLVVVACLGWLLYRAVTDADPVRRRYGWASLFAVLALAGHQLVDFYANFPAVMFALALTLAPLDATSGPMSLSVAPFRWPSRWRAVMGRAAPVLLALGVVGALGFSSWSESVALTQQRAVNAADAGNWSAALPLARRAALEDPQMTPYQFTLGLAASAEGDLTQARDALQRAATVSDFPEAWLDLSAVQLRLGDTSAARASLANAMRLGWQQAQVAVPAAVLYADLGMPTQAATALEYSFLLIPELAGDPYWSSSPGLRAAADQAVAWIAAAGPSEAYQVLLAAGKTGDALRVASQLGAASSSATLYVRAWEGDDSALQSLERAALASPASEAFGLAALAAARAGDQAMVDRLNAIANPGTLGPGHAEPLVAVAQRCGSCPQVTGAAATSWSIFTYRRPVPADLLVLNLPRLAYR